MSEDDEPDAYGREGQREDCWACNATGMEYGETCVACGGYGWVRADLPLTPYARLNQERDEV